MSYRRSIDRLTAVTSLQCLVYPHIGFQQGHAKFSVGEAVGVEIDLKLIKQFRYQLTQYADVAAR
jgi:hypothetical protein